MTAAFIKASGLDRMDERAISAWDSRDVLDLLG
jgi:hypothetical protein